MSPHGSSYSHENYEWPCDTPYNSHPICCGWLWTSASEHHQWGHIISVASAELSEPPVCGCWMDMESHYNQTLHKGPISPDVIQISTKAQRKNCTDVQCKRELHIVESSENSCNYVFERIHVRYSVRRKERAMMHYMTCMRQDCHLCPTGMS